MFFAARTETNYMVTYKIKYYTKTIFYELVTIITTKNFSTLTSNTDIYRHLQRCNVIIWAPSLSEVGGPSYSK